MVLTSQKYKVYFKVRDSIKGPLYGKIYNNFTNTFSISMLFEFETIVVV